MRFKESIKYRSTLGEIMDDLSVNGVELERTLKAIERVNKWLGGIKNGLASVNRALNSLDRNAPISIIDMGCGSGDFLSALRKWSNEQSLKLSLKGIDANQHIVDIAKKNCDDSIEIEQADVFSHSVKQSGQTIVICSLFLHHFSDEQLNQLLNQWAKEDVDCVIVNDLQRSLLAVYLFRLIALVFNFPAMAKFDGELSIRKGFSKGELKKLALDSGFKSHTLRWSWAFRYQLILNK